MNTTDHNALAERLDSLDRKLDRVLEEVEEVRRFRREIDELKDDLTRIGRDVMSSTVSELEDVAPFVRTGDFTDLAKRLVRNTNTLNDVLVQLESARDFLKDATPLARQLMSDSLEQLDSIYTLNETAGLVFSRAAAGAPLDEVARELVQTYRVSPEQARADVDRVVRDLVHIGALEAAPG